MRGLTDYITQAAWSDILTVQYVLVDDCYQQLDIHILPERKFAPRGIPDFSDSEVITIALFGEMVFVGDEEKTLHFIRQYHLDMFPNLLDKARFNRRRHQLVAVMEAIREQLRDRWRATHPLDTEEENLRLVIVRLSRSVPVLVVVVTRAFPSIGGMNGLAFVPARKPSFLALVAISLPSSGRNHI